MIMLSKQDFSPSIDMILTFIDFWNSAINAFVFPFGIMSPSLFNAVAILGLLIISEEVPTLYSEPFEDLDCIVTKDISSYPTLSLMSTIKKVSLKRKLSTMPCFLAV